MGGKFMKIKIFGSIIMLSWLCIHANQKSYPWLKQWDYMYNKTIQTTFESFMSTLQSTHEKINALFIEQAQARIAKGHVFNNKLQQILDDNTLTLIQNAKKTARKIISIARNTFDYKVNNKIHHTLTPSSAHATRNTRPYRIVLTNTYNKSSS